MRQRAGLGGVRAGGAEKGRADGAVRWRVEIGTGECAGAEAGAGVVAAEFPFFCLSAM